MSYTPKNTYKLYLKRSDDGETVFKKSLLSELTTETSLSWNWNYDGIGSHDNTEYLSYQGHDYLKCSHAGNVLVGTWTSPEYDLGALRVAKIQGDFFTLFINLDATWNILFPITSKWSDVVSSISQWNDILIPIPPEELKVKLKWGSSSGVYPNEEYFYNVTHEIEARFVQIEIEITDLSLSENLYVRDLNCTASYWS